MARKRGLYRRKDSRYWWVNLLLADGTRVRQSTRCLNLADAEAFAARLQERTARQSQAPRTEFYEMVLSYAHLAPDKLSSVAMRIEWPSSNPTGPSSGELAAPGSALSLRPPNLGAWRHKPQKRASQL
jgi:hypothetical protein